MFKSIKHAKEFLRAFRNHKWDATENGIFFPEQNSELVWHGRLGIQRNGGEFEFNHNLLPLEGRIYLLKAGIRGSASALSSWYIVPYATNTAIEDDLTAATFGGTLTEFTNYTETTRRPWTTVDPTDTSALTNSASVATITIGNGTGSTNTSVYGAGVIGGANGKGSTAGTLLAASAATTAKTGLEAGETLGFTYGTTLTSS